MLETVRAYAALELTVVRVNAMTPWRASRAIARGSLPRGERLTGPQQVNGYIACVTISRVTVLLWRGSSNATAPPKRSTLRGA